MEEEIEGLHKLGLEVERISSQYYMVGIRTALEKIKAYIEVPEDYPESQIVLRVNSSLLPQALERRIESSTMRAIESLGAKPHVLPAIEFLQKTITQNRLLYCFEEIKQAKQLMSEKDSISLLEKSGAVVLTLSEASFSLKVRIQVPEDYPNSPVSFAVKDSNIPAKVLEIIVNRAKNLLGKSLVTEVVGKIEDETVSYGQIKHDLDFIRVKQDLAEQSDSKDARRMHTRLVKQEIQTEKDAYLAKQGRNQTTLYRTLQPLIQFFVERVIRDIPLQTCVACDRPVFPSKDPEMIVCGHWFHGECLKETMRTPPFEKFCRFCQEKISHPKYPTDPAALERAAKAWAMEQARAREIEDVKDFLDL